MTSTVVEPLGLFELPEPPAKQPTRRNHAGVLPPAPHRTKTEREQTCDPRCLTCGSPEERGQCYPRCAITCVHTTQPARAEVCIVTTRVEARLVVGLPGARPGRRLALVDTCPYCERVHWHSPTPGLRYRIAQCGRPYLVHLPRTAVTPGGTS